MSQASRFQQIVADAKLHIREVSPEEARQRRESGALLIDVRETEDFAAKHAAGATHLSRGVLELKIEQVAPDPATPIVCYCGGGSRSALAVESLQRMGYTNAVSMAGGFKAWQSQGQPTSS